MHPRIKKLFNHTANLLVLQLGIMLIALPILIFWGLPVAPLGIIGNIIFSPILAIFLFLSFLVVFCEILCIPSGFMIFFIEKLSNLWLFLTSLGNSNFLIFLPKPKILFLFLVPLVTLLILHLNFYKKKSQKIKVSFILYVSVLIVFSLKTGPKVLEVPYGKNKIKIINSKDGITLVDPGFPRRKSGILSWINYTLTPELAKNFGTKKIDKIIFEKQTPSTVAMERLLKAKGLN